MANNAVNNAEFDFSGNVLHWFDRHGRHDLPWQQQRTPYRVWLSEIMLQQTQVATVIPYFQRFVARFPSVQSLAAASSDDVLALWSGLGYYARARNLHRAAQEIVTAHDGGLPPSIEGLAGLPGIGRSTAGAILAISRDQRHAILDGNVKRVLTRFHGIAGWPGDKKIETQLWQFAEQHTPTTRIRDYTQAIMDLGATVCTRSRPQCGECPLKKQCYAHQHNDTQNYPQAKLHKALPTKRATMLIVRDDEQRLLLVKRPPTGIWGGLWSLPEHENESAAQQECRHQHGVQCETLDQWPVLRHTFSHFRLEITPVICRGTPTAAVMDGNSASWYNLNQANELGLAAPVRKLIAQLQQPATIAHTTTHNTRSAHVTKSKLRQTQKRS